MLVHCCYVLIFVVSRVSFEGTPQIFTAYLEFYISFVFFIDLFRNFTEPYMKDGRLITNNKLIAKHYMTTWFLMDIYSFLPLAYMRLISNYDEGSKDDIRNLLTFNFERLPRFYNIMLLM